MQPQLYKHCVASVRRRSCAGSSGCLLWSNMLGSSEQLLEAGIVADRVPDRIDFQARDGRRLTRRDGEKSSEILNRFPSIAGLRLNLSQCGHVSGTKERI